MIGHITRTIRCRRMVAGSKALAIVARNDAEIAAGCGIVIIALNSDGKRWAS